MEQILAVEAMFTKGKGKHGYRTAKGMKRFYESWEDGAFCFAPGLLPRFQKGLESLGWTIDVRHVDKGPREQGQLIVGDVEQALDLLQAIRIKWQDAPILVVAHIRDVKNMVKLAGKHMPGVMAANIEEARTTGCRMVAATPYRFSCINELTWDVIVFWSVDVLQTKWAKEGCNVFFTGVHRDPSRPVCCYAIHYGKPMKRLELLTVEQLCGPVLEDYRLQPDAPEVDVVIVRHGGTVPEITEEMTILDRKRAQIWQNRARNELIAQIVEEIAAGDPQRLRELGLVNDELDPESIAIVVESPEHAERLAELLPEWTVRTYAAGPDGCTPNDPTTNQFIVTERYLVENPLKVDILIRATGGPHALALPAGAGLPALRELTLLDFVQVGDNRSERDGQRRAEEYEQSNWPIRWISLAAEGNR